MIVQDMQQNEEDIMFIGVIIPVVQREMFNELMQSISLNTLRPNQIIIIDNSQYGVSQCLIPNCKIDIIRNKPKVDEDGNFIPGSGTNEAWKQGIAALMPNISLVTFLNDDVYLNKLFFEKTYQTFEQVPKCGYLIPSILQDIVQVKTYSARHEREKLHKTKERNGWAFTLRKTYLDACPPIPKEMTIWYGDNWYADLCPTFGYQRLIRWDNPVFHYGGTTSKREIDRASHPVMSRKRKNEHDVFLRNIRKFKSEKEEEELKNELGKLEEKKLSNSEATEKHIKTIKDKE